MEFEGMKESQWDWSREDKEKYGELDRNQIIQTHGLCRNLTLTFLLQLLLQQTTACSCYKTVSQLSCIQILTFTLLLCGHQMGR